LHQYRNVITIKALHGQLVNWSKCEFDKYMREKEIP